MTRLSNVKSKVRPLAAALAVAMVVIVVAAAAAPAQRYQISAGTVLDVKTGLLWQQTVFNGTFSSAFAAASYCASVGSNWRVPTVKELATIVDFSIGPPGPTIDGNAFPNTPTANRYQTATAFGTNQVWSIDFTSADICDSCGACGAAPCFVRCVR